MSGNTADGSGGGVFNYANGNTVAITNSTISNNSAHLEGGAVFHYGTGNTLTIENSTMSGNTSGFGGGGGIYSRTKGGTVTVSHATISGNRSKAPDYTGGGALIFAHMGSVATIRESVVSGNIADDFGGGLTLIARTSATIQVANSTVSGNSAHSDGGVSMGALEGGAVLFTNSTVSGNRAGRYSGGVGIGTNEDGTVVLANSTVSGNSAAYGGGVDILTRGTVTLTNVTVSKNTASVGSGGGVSCSAENRGTMNLSRSLISGNIAPTGAEVFLYDRGGLFTLTLNLFGHYGLTTTQALSGVPAGSDNIVATSDGNKPTALGAILDTTLQNNGGPTATHNLVAGSPAIDAAGATCGLTMDQRGAPRPVDGNGDDVAACDIGAVEFGSFPSSLDCSTATASVQFPRLGNRHRYPVTIAGVTAPPGDEVDITTTSIFQDEPVTNPTGTTCPDGIGVGTTVAKVRNERIITQAGDGRVYHIGFTATDDAGESCTGEVRVCVPLKEGEACGDQGALFDSTVCP